MAKVIEEKDTKAPAETKVPANLTNVAAARGAALQVDGFTRRHAGDVMLWHFCEVVDGEHKGRYGFYDATGEVDKDGYPKTVVVKTRDEHHQNITVNYKDIRPAEAGRR